MSKDNSDYKKSMQQGTNKVTITDESKQKSMGGNVPGSREDSISKQNAAKKKNKK